jgi:hypothetical protein
MTDAENLVRDSYNKVNSPPTTHLGTRLVSGYSANSLFQFYNKVYKIRATEGIQVLIPPKYLDELRNLPEETLSATEAIREVC